MKKNTFNPIRNVKNFTLYLLSNVFSVFKDNKKIIFESHPIYTDNTKQIYDEFVKEKTYNLFWIYPDNKIKKLDDNHKKIATNTSKENSGLVNKIILEIKKIYHFSTCKAYIYSHDYHPRFKPKKFQVFINLTHGQSLKDTRNNYYGIENVDYVITLSNFTKRLRKKHLV